MQMQINTLSSDTLVDAIRNPRNYPDLVVRVAGFSAYFTTLDPAIQRNIVDRAIYELNQRPVLEAPNMHLAHRRRPLARQAARE